MISETVVIDSQLIDLVEVEEQTKADDENEGEDPADRDRERCAVPTWRAE